MNIKPLFTLALFALAMTGEASGSLYAAKKKEKARRLASNVPAAPAPQPETTEPAPTPAPQPETTEPAPTPAPQPETARPAPTLAPQPKRKSRYENLRDRVGSLNGHNKNMLKMETYIHGLGQVSAAKAIVLCEILLGKPPRIKITKDQSVMLYPGDNLSNPVNLNGIYERNDHPFRHRNNEINGLKEFCGTKVDVSHELYKFRHAIEEAIRNKAAGGRHR
ncbi:MAG: hypothetical protein AAF153_02040 [Pseudomonadota bacterium]